MSRLMLKGFAKVDMSDLRSAVPAFLALIMMPLTYSISNGIGIGAIAYVLITLFTGKYKKNDIGITIMLRSSSLSSSLLRCNSYIKRTLA